MCQQEADGASGSGQAVKILRTAFLTGSMDTSLRELAFRSRVSKNELVRIALANMLRRCTESSASLVEDSREEELTDEDMVLRSFYLDEAMDDDIRRIASVSGVTKNRLIRAALALKLREWLVDADTLIRDTAPVKRSTAQNPVQSPPQRHPSVAQFRAARALLDWSQDELAARADVGRATVGDFERGARQPLRMSLRSMRKALEAAGIEFLWDSNGREGVTVTTPRPKGRGF